VIDHRHRSSAIVLAAVLVVLVLMSGIATAREQKKIAFLVYHRFHPATAAPTTVTDGVFEAQLAWLAAHHIRVAPLHSAVDSLRGDTPATEPPCVAITVDDGHRSVYTDMFPLIQRYRIPVTLFVYPSAISNAPYALTWEQLEEMAKSGLVEVQSHTFWHPDFRHEKARRTAADYHAFVALQLAQSKERIEARLGGRADLLAWPYGIHDAELEEAASRAGYRAAFALGRQPALPGADMFALPRYMVSETDRGARFAAMIEAACRETPE
jgi:peptidoglycan/xylan/chitin deacetylase (PgdA/CDA1 family)